MALEEAIERGVIKEEDVTHCERLEQFLGRFGRQFYKLPDTTEGNKIVLTRKGETIPKSIRSEACELNLASHTKLFMWLLGCKALSSK